MPLDGGRVAAALHPAIWIVGLAALVALVIVAPNPILLIILVWRRSTSTSAGARVTSTASRSTTRSAPRQRFAVAVGYFGLAILLTIAMAETHVVRHF